MIRGIRLIMIKIGSYFLNINVYFLITYGFTIWIESGIKIFPWKLSLSLKAEEEIRVIEIKGKVIHL